MAFESSVPHTQITETEINVSHDTFLEAMCDHYSLPVPVGATVKQAMVEGCLSSLVEWGLDLDEGVKQKEMLKIPLREQGRALQNYFGYSGKVDVLVPQPRREGDPWVKVVFTETRYTQAPSTDMVTGEKDVTQLSRLLNRPGVDILYLFLCGEGLLGAAALVYHLL